MEAKAEKRLKLAMIGLGRMGSNMARRLMHDGHEIVVYDRNERAIEALAQEGARASHSLAELKPLLATPRGGYRIVWMMLPAGAPTETAVLELSEILESGDIIIDGGNSYFKDDVRRAKLLESKGLRYLDVGTSGGIWGLERGYSLMIGGDSSAATHLDSVFRSLAPGSGPVPTSPDRKKPGTADHGYLYCGPSGSGHFVKMIHNGVEYGMMQALAEGFDILRGARSEELPKEHRYELSLTEIAEVWRRGSVVSSWLLDLIALSLNRDATLSNFEGHVADSGEGRWTVQAALEEAVPANVLSTALYVRFRSRQANSFAEKILSAMRNEFGGHAEAALENLGKPAQRAS